MVKSRAAAVTTALTVVAITSTQLHCGINAFQPSSPLIHVPRYGSNTPRSTQQILVGGARRPSVAPSKSTIRMAERSPASNTANNSNKRIAYFLLKPHLLLSKPLQKLRKTLTIALASFAFLLASTRVHPVQVAHASSSAALSTTATTSTPTSFLKRLNPLRPKTADELIENYVRQRLFADDAYDPVESAYREVIADRSAASSTASSSSSKDGSAVGEGGYPTLLAETAAAALGKKDASSLISPRSTGIASSSAGIDGAPQKDVITNTLIRTSTFLQRRLGMSESVSYYVVAAGALVGFCVVPAMLGVLYQGLQRMQIDRSEMKMYGKITE
ncbi:hypothetical protein ACHAXS_003664 [Conticribra weissflogii]